MNRDTVKTLAGLLIIGVIVVATFLYGNAQRQNQLKHDAAVKQQQAAATSGGVAKASPNGSAAPAASGTAAPSPTKGTTNTAPVQSPGSSNIQGGATASSTAPKPTSTPQTPAPKPTSTPQTPAPTPTQVATVPQTGGSALPQTGPAAQLAGVLGLAGIVTMWLWVRRSRRAIFTAARNNR